MPNKRPDSPYIVTYAPDLDRLEDFVETWWDKGYRPHGSMLFTGGTYYQPMVYKPSHKRDGQAAG